MYAAPGVAERLNAARRKRAATLEAGPRSPPARGRQRGPALYIAAYRTSTATLSRPSAGPTTIAAPEPGDSDDDRDAARAVLQFVTSLHGP
jgi:hypothetical protein